MFNTTSILKAYCVGPPNLSTCLINPFFVTRKACFNFGYNQSTLDAYSVKLTRLIHPFIRPTYAFVVTSFLAGLLRAFRASGAPWVRNDARNFDYDVTVLSSPIRTVSGGRGGEQPNRGKSVRAISVFQRGSHYEESFSFEFP